MMYGMATPQDITEALDEVEKAKTQKDANKAFSRAFLLAIQGRGLVHKASHWMMIYEKCGMTSDLYRLEGEIASGDHRRKRSKVDA